MKKTISLLLLFAMVAALLCVPAMAAGEEPEKDGIYAVSVESGFTGTVTLTPCTQDNTAVTASGTYETSDFYPEAVRVKVSYTGATNTKFYLGLTLNGDSGIPTAENLEYIDQVTSGGSTVEFNIYPKTLEKDKVYSIYLASNDGMTYSKVASFKYFQAYKLGDVDDSGEIDISDAVCILQALVGKYDLSIGNRRAAADVDKSGEIDISDAVCVLQSLVGKYVIA